MRSALWSLLLLLPTAFQDTPRLTHGPFLGHTTPTTATVWARASEPGEYRLELSEPGGERVQEARATTDEKRDLTLVFQLDGLEPAHDYQFAVRRGETPVSDKKLRLQTAPPENARSVQLAFASCANEMRFEKMPGWPQMLASGADAVVMLGDMPYIDSTKLEVQRRRYREFYSSADLAFTLKQIPFYATWDDHDFGKDDTDGDLGGKEYSRQAFREYHANPTYGEGDAGIYTSFRRGPIEVFLLDTRWFAGTGASPVDEDGKTLLGKAQWEWLKKGLAASTATFKVLASGMIWNGATRPGKTDHWMTYPHEREALFRWIGENEISGVVLVGGDIHRTRALRYPTKSLAGYELTELITSPLANTVIETANAPSPYLLFDAGVQQTFLLLEADLTVEPPVLGGRFLEADGRELFSVELDLPSLSASE